MTKHLIDISDEPVRLRVKHAQLVIEGAERDVTTLPLTEIAAVVVAEPRVSYTHATLAGLAEAGAVLVVCGSRRQPTGLMLPLVGHTTQAERFTHQAAASLPLKKRLWRQLVQAKIKAQAAIILSLRGTDVGLRAMAGRVKSGDVENLEAQAARRYWPVLFPREGAGTSGQGASRAFCRDRFAEDENRCLNYGYAILRAVTARAICAAGLHPCLGLHHHNRYNPFCLADDLMEPFRPLVDGAVARWTDEYGSTSELNRQAKNAILTALMGRLKLSGEDRSLFDILGRVSASLASVFEGKRSKLLLPVFESFPASREGL